MVRHPHITYFKQSCCQEGTDLSCVLICGDEFAPVRWACPHQLCVSPRRLLRIPAVAHTAPAENKDKSSTTRFILLCCCSSLVTTSCLTLCDPMDSSLPGFSVQGDFPGKNTGVGCRALLQGIFLTQGSNPCLLH